MTYIICGLFILQIYFILSLFAAASEEPRGRYLARLWFWLTTTTKCSWCRKTTHRRWLWLPQIRLTKSIRIDRVSHGMCMDCARKMFLETR